MVNSDSMDDVGPVLLDKGDELVLSRSFRSGEKVTYGVGDIDTASEDVLGSDVPVGSEDPTEWSATSLDEHAYKGCRSRLSIELLGLPALHLPELAPLTSWRLTAAGSGRASLPTRRAIPSATVVPVLGRIMFEICTTRTRVLEG